ncbi:MAG: hypothetical protein AB2404_01530 [Planifilum fimeticola]|jgi:hypothetical protein
MESAKTYRKVAFDMSYVQLGWSLWFFGIVLIIYIAFSFLFGMDVQGNNDLGQLVFKFVGGVEIRETDLGRGFIGFILLPAKIYMIICGYSSVSHFLNYFVRHGVTRKAYFYGATIASAVLSLGIALMAGVIVWVEQTVFSRAYLLTPWIVVVLSFALNILAYYAFGWLIGAGFYRYGIGGVLFILLALAWLLATEAMLLLWEAELLKGPNVVPEVLIPFLATLLLFGVFLWIVRMTTGRVRVRL